MTDSGPRTPQTFDPDMNFFNQMLHQLRLTWRLMVDRRVNPFLKVLPVGAVVYLFAPDILPGPFDDAAMAWLAVKTFISLSPPEVVSQHLEEMYKVIPGRWKPGESPSDVVDGQFRPAEPQE